jgi:hypothetical protein
VVDSLRWVVATELFEMPNLVVHCPQAPLGLALVPLLLRLASVNYQSRAPELRISGKAWLNSYAEDGSQETELITVYSPSPCGLLQQEGLARTVLGYVQIRPLMSAH